ncbi:polysaccharide pyruvyl transferase family protein [Flavobacterium sp. RHBU_24]|uniref:polysaccharide pyruvyl transferase family protein n=1 Tax=Flavobacterium sp. RHBU_24 TaxID=3391185 RepID=UPI003984DAA0
MKKIGVITILNVNNYGAELQAFALHHKLKLMGYDNEVINYLYYKNPMYVAEAKSAPLIKAPKINKLKDFVIKWIDKYSRFAHPEIAKVRKERFDNFHGKLTSLSPVYNSYSSLYNANLPYDTVIVGSDQVWNPNNGTNLDPYFLTFAKNGMKKISFASSFGVGKINPEYHAVYKNWLNNIDFIATREADGVKIIKEITGRDATHVVDPTLLLTKKEWESILVPYEAKEPYILLFVFKESKYVNDFAYHLQKQTGYKIIRVCKNEMRVESDDKMINIRDFGPLEFLGLYQNASVVLTTSFHGTVFSLIFEKPFYTIAPGSKNNNSRQQGLLSLMGHPERLINEGDAFPDTANLQIDFTPVREIIERERQKSVSFLENALKA